MTSLLLAISIVLIALGGFYAAAETAMATLPRAELFELAAGARRPWALTRIAHDPESHMRASSFMRVFTQTTSAASVTLILAYSTDRWWLALIVSALIMTAVSFVLVGVSPRTVGRMNPQGVLRFGAGVVAVSRVIIGPMAGSLALFTAKISRARGQTVDSEAQLLHLVDRANEQDVLEDDEKELIHSVFEFGDAIVREVMVPRTDMVTIHADEDLGAAMGLFFSRGLSRVPIIGDDIDDVKGVLYLKDAAKVAYEAPAGTDDLPIAGLARPALFTPESKNIDDLLEQMQAESNHMAIVIDEYGGVAGLVTIEDLIERLVGKIADEYDREPDEVEDLGGGRYRLSPRLSLEELSDLFDVEIEDEDVETVGGLLIKALGDFPEEGDHAEVGGLILVAERVERRVQQLQTVLASRSTALIEAQAAFHEISKEAQDDDEE